MSLGISVIYNDYLHTKIKKYLRVLTIACEQDYWLDSCSTEIDRLRVLNRRLIEDAKRLAEHSIEANFDNVMPWSCSHCESGDFGNMADVTHMPDCPITLHRALMAEINGEPNCTMEEK